MKEILNNISLFYTNRLHPAYDFLVAILVNNQYVIYILIGVVVALLIIRWKIKVRIITGLIDLVIGIVIILLLIAAYSIFSPAISEFIKSNTAINSQPGMINQVIVPK